MKKNILNLQNIVREVQTEEKNSDTDYIPSE